MKPLKRVAVGAADLELDALLDGLERALSTQGYALEGAPGAITGDYDAALLHVRWLAAPGAGAWAVLPGSPHAGRIAPALAAPLGRGLKYHAADGYRAGGRVELSAATFGLAADGQKHPRPNGLDASRLDRITEGDLHSRLMQPIRHLVGIADGPGTSQYEFPIYETDPAAAASFAASGPPEPLRPDRLNETLELLRRPNSRAVIRRDGPDQFLARIEGAEDAPSNVYMNVATGEALIAAAAGEGLRLRAGPDVRGPSLLP